MDEKAIEVENLNVIYHDISALWNINFKIPQKKLVAIVGPNGAGKSTLLKTMMGLIKQHSGKVKLMGHKHDKIEHKHAHVAYVPQRGTVDWDFPVNCLDVVQMGRYGHVGLFKRLGKKEKQLALEALKKFGMEGYSDHQIGQLSGGQRQRVFLARAYVQDADIIFLDEPFGGIDTKTEEMTLELLEEMRDIGKTIVVVTHDLQSLKQHFNLVLLLNTNVIAYGKPDDVLTEKNLRQAYGGLLHMDVVG